MRSQNLYLADYANNRVRKITPLGVITTVAGNGLAGSNGDGGPAIAASLNQPGGVAVDAAGSLFITEYAAGRIRKVSAGGIITTLAGTGESGYGGDGGPAVNARLGSPAEIAADGLGNVYVEQVTTYRIRKITVATPTIAWPAPADIVYGTELGSAQLNAVANVPGTFIYSPPAGTVLSAGTGQTLSVVFTPADTGNYVVATSAVSITVLTAGQATARLAAAVNALPVQPTDVGGLLASLDAAMAAFNRGASTAGVNQLRAFQNKVRAQSGKQIDAAAADALVMAAQAIIDVT